MRTVKRILIITLAAAVVLCAGGAALIWRTFDNARLDTTGQVDFVRPLPIPPLAPSTVDAAGRRVVDLTARAGLHDFGAGAVPTLGFNGSYLGPTVRAKRGEQLLINVHNGLTEPTTVHWHGAHLPAKADGGPFQQVAPGATWSPSWLVDQPAATLWYHPHPHGSTADQVYRGLAGMLIVDDPATDAPTLPHQYGVDDIPVIVQDKQFSGDELNSGGSFLNGLGILGDTIVVNGALAPYLNVTTTRIRLRLLNASNARAYQFTFADGRVFDLVGSDGGLLAAPDHTDRVMLAAGERAEIVVAMRPGERVVLRSSAPPLGLGFLADRLSGGSDTLDLLELRAAPTLAGSAQLPPRLVDVPRLDPAQAVTTRAFALGDNNINGKEMSSARVDASVRKGSVEIWRVTNRDGTMHSFHVHGVQFQVLSVGGRPPGAPLAGWKDTIYLIPNTEYRIILRFPEYADPNTAYMFHCHVLYHEDRGMMGQFVVTD